VAVPGRSLPPEERDVGLVFQDYALFPHLTILENVMFGLAGERGEARRKAREMLAQVRMEEHAAHYPHELSGGEQQRVALARALAPGPKVMLLDEPFSGLDARTRDAVRDQTLHLLKASGASVLMVTHDAEEAMFMADRIALMRKGRVEQLGTPNDLYFRPASAFAAEFFGEVNVVEGVAEDGRVETPLGAVAVFDLADGTPVDVVIRPEGLIIEAANGTASAQVMTARLLGRTSLVHMSVPSDEAGGELHIHARVQGAANLNEGQQVGLALDPTQTFVFPRGARPTGGDVQG
jgi:iron(III) transport system ATP-binding protein